MKNKVYEAWYIKNKKEILKKRKEAYLRRKQYLNNIKMYQIDNNIEVIEIQPKLYTCNLCDVNILDVSKNQHFKTKYHKYNLSIFSHSSCPEIQNDT